MPVQPGGQLRETQMNRWVERWTRRNGWMNGREADGWYVLQQHKAMGQLNTQLSNKLLLAPHKDYCMPASYLLVSLPADQTSEDQITTQDETSEDQTSDQDQTTDLLAQQAALMMFLGEKVLTDRKEEDDDPNPAVLSPFIGSLEDREWQSVQDRMVELMSQTHLAQVSERIIRVVSQLLTPTLKVQLQPEDHPRVPTSEIKEEEHISRSSAVLRPVARDLQKYLEINEETLVRPLGSSASQLSVSMLGDVVKQLNQGLCVLAAQNQDNAETEGAEVTSAAMKLLAVAGETLAALKDEAVNWDQDVDVLSEKAAEEVMFAIADTMNSCQDEGRKSTRILRDLAAKISEQRSVSSHR
ncbi:uncharacterized protein AKAME5_000749100 [Lates japonicus]|uniref:Uncharacterized protein n=1 Tax=Lates japonicus TaxID=270547 RepID=A0AAD3R4K5_LATJO|nr:uncharacterized protein AKAME5_000749100 [Lates japonicus]